MPRYSYPVNKRGLVDTIRQARYLIDLSLGLEESETGNLKCIPVG